MPLSLYEIMIAIVTRKPAEFNSSAALPPENFSEGRLGLHDVIGFLRSQTDNVPLIGSLPSNSKKFLLAGVGAEFHPALTATRAVHDKEKHHTME